MLTYSYKTDFSIHTREIEVNDFYISPDLLYLSGTTSPNHLFGVGQRIKVKTDYYPEPEYITVASTEVVKRNGFLMYDKPIEIKTATYTAINEEEIFSQSVKYIEVNGDTYYQDLNKSGSTEFMVDGNLYTTDVSATTINIQVRSYVEDGYIDVDGIKYSVLINHNNAVTFADTMGNSFTPPPDWDVSFITRKHEYVKKFSLNPKSDMLIATDSITRYGYRPYIKYKGERLYFRQLYDEEGLNAGFGVKMDGVNYNMLILGQEGDGVVDINDYPHPYDSVNPYSKEAYLEFVGETNLVTINNRQYELCFEPDHVDSGDIIAIRTQIEHLPILLGDTLIAYTSNKPFEVNLETDISGNTYASINGCKYNTIKNLCDCVIVNGTEYPLDYVGNPEAPFVGMIATCKLNDGNVVHFRVNSLQEDELSVKDLKKVNFDESGNTVDAYTVALSGDTLDTVIYTNAQLYTVNNYDGVQINDYKTKVLTIHKGELDNQTDRQCIIVNYSQEYKLTVIDTIGSNLILCRLDITNSDYTHGAYHALVNSIIDTLVNNPEFSIRRPSTIFGTKHLTYKDWLYDAIVASQTSNYEDEIGDSVSGGSVSIYELSNIYQNIHLENSMDYLSFPITLSKSVDNSLNQSDLIMNYHYDEVIEDGINELVDMEKDMYSPIFMTPNGEIQDIEEIEFNLHFRTRDMETWKINEENGESINNNINNQFTNWFITDYYPYNAYSNSGSTIYDKPEVFDKMANQSDLLGFLYFTTDDVKVKRKKLAKSFLRITYFDSKDPIRQNMLGTSTIYFDCDRYYDILYTPHPEYMFAKVVKSLDWDRIHNGKLKEDGTVDEPAIEDRIMMNYNTNPTVLTELFKLKTSGDTLSTADLALLQEYDLPRLDSRITITDRYTSGVSSEGFYSYILKTYANKKATQTIYMKIEFFHAGIGIKIPMVLATDEKNAAINEWTLDKLNTFKQGYKLEEIYDRLYIPIDIFYSTKRRQFVYTVSNQDNYSNSTLVGNKLRFNLFELKIKGN